MAASPTQRQQRTRELARTCDAGAQLDLRELANIAWYRYMHWLQRLAMPKGTQLELDAANAGAQAKEWRGIWCAIEREIHARGESARGRT